MVVVGGVLYHVTNAGSHPSKQQHTDLALGEDNLGIAYGAGPEQVLHRLGQPNEKHGACWVYDAAEGKVNGVSTLQGARVDAMKYCFAERPTGGQAVSDIEWHFKAHTYHHVHYPAQWGQPEYIGCNAQHPCVPTQP